MLHELEHEVRRTVTEADNMWFSNMTLNTQPLHIDHDFASKTEFGQPPEGVMGWVGVM